FRINHANLPLKPRFAPEYTTALACLQLIVRNMLILLKHRTDIAAVLSAKEPRDRVNIRIMLLRGVGDYLEMERTRKKHKVKKKRLHPSAGQKPRGRPGVDRSRVLQTADQLRVMLPDFWPRLVEPLLAARSSGDVTRAFEVLGLVSTRFVPHWSEL